MRRVFPPIAVLVVAGIAAAGAAWPPAWYAMVVVGPLVALGAYDYVQTRHSVLRNFPVLGHFRYWFEAVRPEINQYFVESDTDGVPFNRIQRSLVYQRAKGALDTMPFGTRLDVYAPGYEWVNPSLHPRHVDPASLRVTVGGPDCARPYCASLLNISAMSYGALSRNAIVALNRGAREGGFAHNTGEGGLSPYHLQGGDLIWQIGTGYFGCRTRDGRFDPGAFAERAARPEVKMIEVKLSQGAKPGHGGILPAAKLTPEIARIRMVPMGRDVVSPPAHSAFATPRELMHFVAELRRLSGGRPVGLKLCVGPAHEVLALCLAMRETGIAPDFVTVDGAEGGTGAAPVEFSNHVGTPLFEGLALVHNALVGFDLRDRVRVLCAGKVVTGFDVIQRLALGADACYAARSMMLALGCIQALRCNSNHCPTGVATQDPALTAGLVPDDKAPRVARYHAEVMRTTAEIVGAMGLESAARLRPEHIHRRMDDGSVRTWRQLYPRLERGELLGGTVPPAWRDALAAASADTFAPVGGTVASTPVTAASPVAPSPDVATPTGGVATPGGVAAATASGASRATVGTRSRPPAG